MAQDETAVQHKPWCFKAGGWDLKQPNYFFARKNGSQLI